MRFGGKTFYRLVNKGPMKYHRKPGWLLWIACLRSPHACHLRPTAYRDTAYYFNISKNIILTEMWLKGLIANTVGLHITKLWRKMPNRGWVIRTGNKQALETNFRIFPESPRANFANEIWLNVTVIEDIKLSSRKIFLSKSLGYNALFFSASFSYLGVKHVLVSHRFSEHVAEKLSLHRTGADILQQEGCSETL